MKIIIRFVEMLIDDGARYQNTTASDRRMVLLNLCPICHEHVYNRHAVQEGNFVDYELNNKVEAFCRQTSFDGAMAYYNRSAGVVLILRVLLACKLCWPSIWRRK